MKNVNWFKYRQYLGYAMDLGRIFPLLSKQNSVSKFIGVVNYQLTDFVNSNWTLLLDFGQQFNILLIELIPSWIYEFGLIRLISLRIETACQIVLR
jgi:hypothetical protein